MKSFYTLCLIILCHIASAQVELPDPSPEASFSQHVGYTRINLRYGRPAARNRKIFGALVPYGKVWRTGAGRCTIVQFDASVTIGGRNIPAGAYALLTMPNTNRWTVILNSDTTKVYGRPDDYRTTTELYRFDVTPEKTARYYESLSLMLDVTRYDAELTLAWENTQIRFGIQTHSDSVATARLETALKQSPDNPDLLGQAVEYMALHYNKDMPRQLQLVDRALAIEKSAWLYRLKTDIYSRQGRPADLQKTVKEAVAFLKETKPEGWQRTIGLFEEQLNH
ncbi:DUF2911 domain-containing protein [Dawidia soli]|uniref:DUF2911 domain-containing protein n=1 Tax=Dawidia soli TaxID=2782352 RepID=A0AAP2D4B9_9BACT|nr:DUF2911 domain-containing protein [Dawidia soli]MBT1685068.1 DUF2911 domain-containing protein [Dawidia soli]